MSYASIDDLINRIDQRLLGDLVSDTNQRVVSLTGNTVLQAMLDGAAGEIDMAAFRGQRYNSAQLSSLTGQDQQILFDINCYLAFWRLRLRRGLPVEAKDYPQIDWAQKMINHIAEGELIFATLGAEESGIPATEFIPIQNYYQMNLLRDRTTIGYFSPRRVQNLPPPG